MLDLTAHRATLIKNVGRPGKRANIAVEILTDPRLFFLDEPTTGLDSGSEKNLMQSIRALSRNAQL